MTRKITGSWGRKLANPLTGKKMLAIADKFVDPDFGTGVVKLTPAHDRSDYEVAIKHNLPIVSAFGLDGKMVGFKEFDGLGINKARKRAVELLTAKGLLEKVDKNYQNSVAVCYKCGKTVEPLVMPNWFVKVDKLKKPAHEVVKKGDVKIYPKWQEIKYHRWMEEMHDWPISRQIVWGIRIPAWYNLENQSRYDHYFPRQEQEVN